MHGGGAISGRISGYRAPYGAKNQKKKICTTRKSMENVVRFPNPLDIGSDFSSQAGTLSRKMTVRNVNHPIKVTVKNLI